MLGLKKNLSFWKGSGFAFKILIFLILFYFMKIVTESNINYNCQKEYCGNNELKKSNLHIIW